MPNEPIRFMRSVPHERPSRQRENTSPEYSTSWNAFLIASVAISTIVAGAWAAKEAIEKGKAILHSKIGRGPNPSPMQDRPVYRSR